MAWSSPTPAAEPRAGRDADAAWTMNVPDGYRQSREDNGHTLVLSPPSPEKFVLRFTFHSLADYVAERPRVGREFIAHLAAKKNLKTFEVPGNGGLAYVEPPVVSEQDGGRVHETEGSLGLDDAYVTFTVMVDEASRDDPVVQELLRSGLQVLLGRIRSRR